MSSPVRSNPFAGLPGAPTLWTRLRTLGITALIMALFVWSARETDFSLVTLVTGLPKMKDLIMRMLPFTREALETGGYAYGWSWDLAVKQVRYAAATWHPLMETLRVAIVSATFGALLSIPFSLLSARNLVRYGWLYWTVRSLMSFIRTIPDMVLAAVFVGAFGVGILPGIMAMTIFSWAIMSKLMSESIEAIDHGPLEALWAAGANRIQMIRYAVVPQVLPQFSSYTLYMFEINVRASFVLGFVGAGGIGHLLRTQLNFLKFREVFTVIMVILFAVILIDYVSNRLRERLL